jgi:hypothetical protein
MHWILRTTALVTATAVVFHCSLPALAQAEATIEGTVKIPCDPPRVREVTSVEIRPVSGGSATTVAVDSSTGTFRGSGLTEGEYELMAFDAEGLPLSREPKRLLLSAGTNTVVLSMEPPGCGDPDFDRDGVPDSRDACPTTPPGMVVGADGCLVEESAGSGGLKDWHLTLIYVGAVGVAVLLLNDDDDDEAPASPF